MLKDKEKTSYFSSKIGQAPVNESVLSEKLIEYLENWQVQFPEDVFPTLERFSLSVGSYPERIIAKGHKIKRFSKLLRRLKALQKLILMQNGANKAFDSGTSKFLLSAVHGLKEKSDITSKNKSISLSVTNGADV